MATSGSTNFSQSRNEVILDALSLLGCNSIGKDPAPEDIAVCSRFLNKMIKAWQAQGLHLWTKEEGILFLTPYVGQYDLGLESTPFAVRDSVITTMLTSAINNGATSISVKSTVGVTPGAQLGIVGDNGYIYWTTVVAVANATTIQVPAISSLVASSGQYVYIYSVKAGKPLRVLNARTLGGIDLGAEGSSLVEAPLTMIAYQSYWEVGMTTVNSDLPNQAAYMPKDTRGRLYVWPRPLRGDRRVQLTYERMIEDMDDIRDDFDFPSEWLEPLTYQLALRVGTIFGKEQKAATIAPLAQSMLKNLLDWDTEITSVTFQPYYGSDDDFGGDSGGRGWGR